MFTPECFSPLFVVNSEFRCGVFERVESLRGNRRSSVLPKYGLSLSLSLSFSLRLFFLAWLTLFQMPFMASMVATLLYCDPFCFDEMKYEVVTAVTQVVMTGKHPFTFHHLKEDEIQKNSLFFLSFSILSLFLLRLTKTIL